MSLIFAYLRRATQRGANSLRRIIRSKGISSGGLDIYPGSDFSRTTSDQIQACDQSLFPISSQIGPSDKNSLLTVQNIVRRHAPGYVYIEVGSHLGGTLTPHLVDPLCKAVYSIDKRPLSQLDERGTYFDYVDNSTQKMIETLRTFLPHTCLAKLQTFDMDASEVRRNHISLHPDLAFIDGEHTNTAAFRDFLSIYKFCKKSSIIVFHDVAYVADAIVNVESLLTFLKVRYGSYILADCVCVMLFNDYVDIAEKTISSIALDKEDYLRRAKTYLWQEIARNNRL